MNTGNCTICPKIEVCFRGTDGSSSEETASDGDQNSSAINYFKWVTVDGKVQKVSCEIDRAEANNLLKEKVKILKYHLYVQFEQHKAYNNIKNNMGENEMLVHVDFAENYENKQQSEIQSAYFGHTTSAYLLLAVTPEVRMVRFIGSPKDFAEFADANVNNISVIYV